jgi:flagellar protein FliS
MPQAGAYAAYKKSATETAPPEKLLLMLFDGGIKFLIQAQSALEEKEYEKANNLLLKVQDILNTLLDTLDFDKGGKIAKNLQALYIFYRNELVQANLEKNSERLFPVLKFFQSYREMWAEAAIRARQGSK